MGIERQYCIALCEDAQANRNMYLAESERQVVKWEYAEWSRYEVMPFYFERNCEKRARVSKNETDLVYGLDAEGNVLVSKIISQGHFTCQSISHDRRITRKYENDKLDSIEIIFLEADLPIHYVEFIVRQGISSMQSWYFEEAYQYEGAHGRITSIVRDEYWHVGDRHYLYQLAYDDKGKLSHIKDQDDFTIYAHLKKSEAAILRTQVLDTLVLEWRKELLKYCDNNPEPDLCFAAIYLHDAPMGVCNPIVQLGSEETREEQLQENTDKEYLWYSGEHPTEYQMQLQNKFLFEQFSILVQYWQINRDWWRESKKFWHEAAQQLNRINWGEISPLTKDFVFYVEVEAFHFKRDFRKSVPENKLSALVARGLC
ncbi:hypothetical protein B1748_20385 [Paenibacillus sp. MY03]|uniref:hypothetical protein n=1 Tax=Paenibacillus sp. MY03 TaxID=302980 RepID=UPI000B3CAA66|nr:hypothetical protein [Paenibacillus sp. MY03]OUS74838.1 hypothetical protein B1748_20385 [Paenibacillus sp. MY03]